MPVLSPFGLIAMNGGSYEWPSDVAWHLLQDQVGPYVSGLRWLSSSRLAYSHVTDANRLEVLDLNTGVPSVAYDGGFNQLVAGGGVWAVYSTFYADSHGTAAKPWFPQCVDTLSGDIALTIDQAGHDLHVWDGSTLTPIMSGVGFASSFTRGTLCFRLNNVWYHWTRAEGVKTIGTLDTVLGGAQWSNGWNLGWWPSMPAQVIWPDWDPEHAIVIVAYQDNYNAAILRETPTSSLITVVGSRGAGELPGEQQVFTVDLLAKTVNGQPWQMVNLRGGPPDPPHPPIVENETMLTLKRSALKRPSVNYPGRTLCVMNNGQYLHVDPSTMGVYQNGSDDDRAAWITKSGSGEAKLEIEAYFITAKVDEGA